MREWKIRKQLKKIVISKYLGRRYLEVIRLDRTRVAQKMIPTEKCSLK